MKNILTCLCLWLQTSSKWLVYVCPCKKLQLLDVSCLGEAGMYARKTALKGAFDIFLITPMIDMGARRLALD